MNVRLLPLAALAALAISLAQADSRKRIDSPKKISISEFFAQYSSLETAHTRVEITGVYARYVGVDLLYRDGADAFSYSLNPLGGQRPIPMWIGNAPAPIAARLKQCLEHPDRIAIKSGEHPGQCDVTVVGHVESCAVWGASAQSAVLRMEPTRLLANQPAGGEVLACLVVDGGRAA
jgi:hypothetical protein